MDVRLEVVHDKSRAKQVRLRRDTVVGRGKDCQLRIPVADVSRRHCQFTLQDERLLLRDLGSSNGTQVGGRTIPAGKDVQLTDGDTITVGPVSFIVHLSLGAVPSDDSAGEPPSPQRASLQDTAEFEVTDSPGDNGDEFNTETDTAPTDTELAPTTVPESTPPDSAIESPRDSGSDSDDTITDDDQQASVDDSVIDLELSDSQTNPPHEGAPLEADPATPAPSSVMPSEKPLKSRSLFGLFRRRPATIDDDEVSDDDLMEEPGEDPPPDPDATATEPLDGSIADGHPAATQTETTEPPPGSSVPETDSGDSVFDDDAPDEEASDSGSMDEMDIEEIAEDGDTVSFDFLEDGSQDAAPDTDDLNDFLGQFGK